MTPPPTTDVVLRTPSPRLEPIGDKIYAYIQPPGGWCVNNVGIVADDNGVILIDTVATEGRARLLRDTVEVLDAGPVRTVVNTHFHGDHTFGNGLMGEQVTIIAHELTREDMASTGIGMTRLWPEVDWGDVAPLLPTVTFRDRLWLRPGGQSVELIHVGTAHTRGDIVAWLPDERILFAGDVAFSGVTPYILMGSLSGSLRALDRLRALQPRIVVCGHGPVSGPDVLDTVESYLRWLWRLAKDGLNAGHDQLQVARSADLGEFRVLQDSERLVGNLYRVYAELQGMPPEAPLDVLAVHRDMNEYHGGQPLTSLA